jgi:hypothetical protein
MSTPGKKRRSWVGLLILALVAFVDLIGLGPGMTRHFSATSIMPRSPGLRCVLDVPALRIRSRLTPARLANGKIVMVTRGFVPERRRDSKTPPRWQITGPIDL